MVSILKGADAGMKVKEIFRKHGISDATYYNWKSKYGGMGASDMKRLKRARVGAFATQVDVRQIGT
jgi:putative transposase